MTPGTSTAPGVESEGRATLLREMSRRGVDVTAPRGRWQGAPPIATLVPSAASPVRGACVSLPENGCCTGLATWEKEQNAGFGYRGCWVRSAHAGFEIIEDMGAGPPAVATTRALERHGFAAYVPGRTKGLRMCDSCGRLLEENEQLTNEISGLMFTVRKQGATMAGLAAELRKAHSEDPKSKDIEFVVTRWKRLCGHPRAKCPVDGKAWKAVKRALGPWGYTLEEVLEAVEGAALAPYDAGYGKRKVAGLPKERKDDLGYILRDEENIQKFRDISRRGHAASYAQLNLAHIALMSTEKQYLTLMIEACARQDSTSLQVARAWHYSVGEEAPVRAETREAA